MKQNIVDFLEDTLSEVKSIRNKIFNLGENVEVVSNQISNLISKIDKQVKKECMLEVFILDEIRNNLLKIQENIETKICEDPQMEFGEDLAGLVKFIETKILSI